MIRLGTVARPGLVQRLAQSGPVRLLVMAFVMLLAANLASVLQGVPSNLALRSIVTFGLCAGLIAFYRVLTFFFEKHWPQETAFSPRWTGLGFLTGFSLFCVVYLVLGLTGVATWHGVNGLTAIHQILLPSLVAAVGEELVFRGVLFRGLERSLGTTVALLVSAALFGVLHAVNPGATVVSTLAIALEAGVLLAAAYAWSRSLWFVFGLHFAWNFTEGGVFGAAVSGHPVTGILDVRLSETAPALLSGGAFGPEASVLGLLVCLALAAALIRGAVRAGRWQGPAFQRPSRKT